MTTNRNALYKRMIVLTVSIPLDCFGGNTLQVISKKGFWFQIAAEAKFKPEAY